jgi:type I restriction-modification system DNA methylase subunit
MGKVLGVSVSLTKEQAKEKIEQLVADFESRKDYYFETEEANVETKLIEPLFEALGWTKSDFEKRQKVTGRSGRRQIPDYTFRLKEKIVFFLEAKKVSVDIETDQDTWRQAISYALSKRVPFAVLTNFRSIRVFCVEQENAAKNVFRHIRYSELKDRFADLWLLSKESFEKNEILQVAESEQRLKKRIKIDDPLLEDFITSRKKIVASLGKNYPDRYTMEEKEDLAQRLLGRLIFIRKAEDIGINIDNEGKDIEFLDEITKLPDDEAFPKLKKIFLKYEEVFDSELFMRMYDSDLAHVEIEGKIVKELVKHLYESRNGDFIYNFDWITSDVLGNVYEQYLGNIIRETAKGAKAEESRPHRKEQGIYYTPTYVVDYIVRSTLGELIKDKKSSEVDKIKMLDPACGSGSFLIKAFDVLDEYYSKHDKDYVQARLDIAAGSMYTRKRKILENNLFGVDLDKKAVEISQLNLLLKIAEKGHQLPLLRNSIKCGNSLIDDPAVADKAFKWEEEFKKIMDEGKFDAIVGNPPWVESKKFEQKDKQFYEQHFLVAKKQYDLFTIFIERGLQKLSDGGILGFIIPDRFITNLDYQPFREFLLNSCKILKIIHLGDNVFPDVNMPSAILIIKKEKSKDKRDNNVVQYAQCTDKVLSDIDYGTKIQKEFLQNEGFVFSIFSTEQSERILRKIKNDSINFGEIVNNARGVEIGKDNEIVSDRKIDANYVKFLIGEDIDRYGIISNHYIRLNKSGIDYKEPDLYVGPKILIRKTGLGIRAVLDLDAHYVIQVIYIFKTKRKDFDERYLLAILNSKLMQFYYFSVFGQRDRKIFPHLTQGKVLQLPIKVISKSQQQSLIDLADKMLSLNKRLNEIGDKRTDERVRIEEDIKKTDAEIDKFVYALYGLTEEEIKIVEESLKP